MFHTRIVAQPGSGGAPLFPRPSPVPAPAPYRPARAFAQAPHPRSHTPAYPRSLPPTPRPPPHPPRLRPYRPRRAAHPPAHRLPHWPARERAPCAQAGLSAPAPASPRPPPRLPSTLTAKSGGGKRQGFGGVGSYGPARRHGNHRFSTGSAFPSGCAFRNAVLRRGETSEHLACAPLAASLCFPICKNAVITVPRRGLLVE